MNKIKFLKKGIKVNGQYFPVWYHKGDYTKMSKIPNGSITIYVKSYKGVPDIEGLTIQNDSDMQTDYFEKDRIRVFPTSKYYKEVYKQWLRNCNDRLAGSNHNEQA